MRPSVPEPAPENAIKRLDSLSLDNHNPSFVDIHKIRHIILRRVFPLDRKDDTVK